MAERIEPASGGVDGVTAVRVAADPEFLVISIVEAANFETARRAVEVMRRHKAQLGAQVERQRLGFQYRSDFFPDAARRPTCIPRRPDPALHGCDHGDANKTRSVVGVIKLAGE